MRGELEIDSASGKLVASSTSALQCLSSFTEGCWSSSCPKSQPYRVTDHVCRRPGLHWGFPGADVLGVRFGVGKDPDTVPTHDIAEDGTIWRSATVQLNVRCFSGLKGCVSDESTSLLSGTHARLTCFSKEAELYQRPTSWMRRRCPFLTRQSCQTYSDKPG